ncbi:DEKNAAC100630 [Brettanomyces naardenensis]|uniref:Transcriptional protein SWT1 n=1 Tax=Brettanomyces naardenensis TaxID=13370 RepID=A0A448YEZ3_BRENA|nr:DEKNAAC100630 [Brettanomyces naardenensis]
MNDIDMSDVDNAGDLSQITDITLQERNNEERPRNVFQQFGLDRRSESPRIEGQQVSNIYMVIDTNFIISHLHLLNDLQSLHKEYHDAYKIIIPKQVTSELDGLKNVEKYQDGLQIGKMARAAIDWCYKNMHDNDVTVRGQKLYESIDQDAIKDDSILDCCLYFKMKHPGSLIILMSNDKNLCVKALTNEILTISYRKGMTSRLIASKVIEESGSQGNVSGPLRENLIDEDSHAFLRQSTPEMHEDDEMIIDDDDNSISSSLKKKSFEEVASDVFSQAQTLVLEAVDYAVKTAFGDDIELIGYDPSKVDNLREACFEIRKLGISTFSEYFRRRSVFDPIKTLEDNRQLDVLSSVPADLEHFKEFKEFWSRFLQAIYKKRDKKLTGDLKMILSVWDRWEHDIE